MKIHRLIPRKRSRYKLTGGRVSPVRRRLVRAAALSFVLVLTLGFIPWPLLNLTGDGGNGSSKLTNTTADGYGFSIKQKVFRIDERPELVLSTPTSGRVGWLERHLGAAKVYADTPISSVVKYNDVVVDMPVEIITEQDGTYRLRLAPNDRIKPGSYTVTAKIQTASGSEEISQTFAWGVLAVNTTRPLYVPGETAEIHMAVLSSSGNTICDAPLGLTVTNPAGQQQKLEVRTSGVCRGDSYVELPDYTASYKTQDAGKYRMDMQLDTSDYVLTEYFEVRDDIPYVITRSAPTRLFPPATYKSEILITAGRDFTGQVTEGLPKGFTVLNPGTARLSANDGEPVLTWDARMEKGKTYTFSYDFKSAPQSPAFYQFAPLKLQNGTKTEFTETRQWQQAGDAAITYINNVANNNSGATSVVVTISTTTGNLLVANIHVNSETAITVTSVTDTASNTWTKAVNTTSSTGSGNRAEIWYAANATAVSSVTVTISAAQVVVANISEYSGVATSSPLDGTPQGVSRTSCSTGGSACTSPSLTTTNADDLLVTTLSVRNSGSPTFTGPGSPWNLLTHAGNDRPSSYLKPAYQIVAATGTYSASWDMSVADTVDTAIVAFKAAGCTPVTADLMRGGNYFCAGAEAGFFWAK